MRYFSGSFIRFESESGIKAGQIQSFTPEGRIVILSSGNHQVIGMQQVQWRGLSAPACVAYKDHLAFVGPSGVRSYKKPPSQENMTAIMYKGGACPIMVGEGATGGHIPTSLIEKYTADDTIYPQSSRNLDILMTNSHRPIALSSISGAYYNTHEGEWWGVKRGVVVSKGCDARTLFKLGELN